MTYGEYTTNKKTVTTYVLCDGHRQGGCVVELLTGERERLWRRVERLERQTQQVRLVLLSL